LVTRANAWARKLGLSNCHYICASANISMEPLLKTYPGKVKVIAVQFPDPHFKRKHHKRRVVQFPFLNAVARLLPEGGTLFMQSDVEEICAEMRDRADVSEFFDRVSGNEYSPRDPLMNRAKCAKGELETESVPFWTPDGKRAIEGAKDFGDWLLGENPIGLPTEREVQNTALSEPIYRCVFHRNGKEYKPDLDEEIDIIVRRLDNASKVAAASKGLGKMVEESIQVIISEVSTSGSSENESILPILENALMESLTLIKEVTTQNDETKSCLALVQNLVDSKILEKGNSIERTNSMRSLRERILLTSKRNSEIKSLVLSLVKGWKKVENGVRPKNKNLTFHAKKLPARLNHLVNNCEGMDSVIKNLPDVILDVFIE